MRVLIMGEGPEAESLGEGLEASGISVDRRAGDDPASKGAEEIAEIARDLREFERALGDPGADAVLAASDSSAALAAVLVATKLGIPVACLDSPDGVVEEGPNARLIRQLADTTLAPDPAAIVDWVRDSYAPRA